MKKFTTVLCLVLIAAVGSQAQEFKKFRVGLGGGYAKPGGEGSGGGVLATLEPGYRINDQLLVNLRLETAAVIRGTADATSASLDVAGIKSYTVNGQYFLSTNSFRPFVGAGVGLFSLAAAKLEASSSGSAGTAAAAESKVGFYPRVGFDYKHFTINLDYNIIGATKATIASGSTTTNTEFKNSYFGIRIGGYFGGGRK